MPNPDDECKDCTEWVEIYTTTEHNLTGWQICDDKKCQLLTCLNNESNHSKSSQNNSHNQDYIIIISKKGLNFTNFTNVCITSSSLGLNNNKDVISLKYNNITIDKIAYNNTKENIAICRCGESITTCTPTPQNANACESKNSLNINIPAAIIQNNIFVVAINAINSSYAGCYDVKIEVKQNNTYCKITQAVNLSEWQSSYYYLKNINLTSNNFFINCSKAGITTIQVKLRKCNSTNIAYESDIFAVYAYQHKIDKQNTTMYEQNESSTAEKSMLQIQKITNAKFGNTAKMYVTIYRNDTRKYAVYAYITDGKKLVSEKTTVYVKTKYTNISLAIPIQLNECGNVGNYTAVIEGLGTKHEMPIYIEGKDCKIQPASITETTGYFSSTNDAIVKTTIVNSIAVIAFIQPTVDVYDVGVLEIALKLNNTRKTKNLTVYSYVKSNGKCVSCFDSSKDANKITLKLKTGQTASVRLTNIIKSTTGKATAYIVIKAGSRKKTIKTEIIVHNKGLSNAFITAYKSKQESISEQQLLWLTAGIALLALSIIFKKHT